MISIQFTNADDNDSYIDHRQLELPAIPSVDSFLTLDGKFYRVGNADWDIWTLDVHRWYKVRVSLYPIRPDSN